MRLLIVSSHYEGDEILDQDSNKYGNQLSFETVTILFCIECMP